jgi:hypothetical protein
MNGKVSEIDRGKISHYVVSPCNSHRELTNRVRKELARIASVNRANGANPDITSSDLAK